MLMLSWILAIVSYVLGSSKLKKNLAFMSIALAGIVLVVGLFVRFFPDLRTNAFIVVVNKVLYFGSITRYISGPIFRFLYSHSVQQIIAIIVSWLLFLLYCALPTVISWLSIKKMNKADTNRKTIFTAPVPPDNSNFKTNPIISAITTTAPDMAETIHPDEYYVTAEPISQKRRALTYLTSSQIQSMKDLVQKNGCYTLARQEYASFANIHLPEATYIAEQHRIDIEDIKFIESLDPLIEDAFRAGNNGRYAAAIEGYKKCLNRAPGAELFLMSIGTCSAFLGDFETALKYLERAYEISPENKRIADNLRNIKADIKTEKT